MENKEQNKIRDFKDLKAWQEAHKLAILIYKLTKTFPQEERYSMVDQMRRAAVSVTSNIAEGFGRFGAKEKGNFFRIASGSLTELESQLLLARDIGYVETAKMEEVTEQLRFAQRLLHGLISKTKSFTNSVFHSKLSLFMVPLILFSFICSLFFTTAEAATIGRPSNYLTLNQGLVGWWTFDGPDLLTNVRDRSGQGNHGYLFGQTSTTTVSGKIGQGLFFDGVNDAINSSLIANDIGTGSVTISAWVKLAVPHKSDSVSKAVFSINDNPSTNDIRFCFDGTTGSCPGAGAGTFCLIVYSLSQNSSCTTQSSWSAGVWYHMVGVLDTAVGGNQKVYINGVLSGTHVNNLRGVTQSVRSYIGAEWNTTVGTFFPGSLDDIRIYNRALSAQEIKALYNSGAAKLGASPRPSVSDNLSEGLVGHWTFDGSDLLTNVRDRSGQGNHGAMLGFTSTSSARTPGVLGQALNFDGVDDYVDAGLGADITGALTLTAWIRGNATAAADFVFGRGQAPSANSNSKQYMLYTSSAERVGIQVSNGITPLFSLGELGNLPNGVWKFIVGIYDGVDTTTLYVDGVQVDTDTIESFGTLNSAAVGLGIGSRQTGGTAFFDGSLDDVRIYNRALSADEVKQLYNETAGAKQAATPTGVAAPSGCTSGLTCGLVGHWTFDGPDINWATGAVADKSGSGNTGYVAGMSTTTARVAGKLGQALYFDGVNDYVVMSPYTMVGTEFSYSFWMRHSSFGTISQMIIDWGLKRYCRTQLGLLVCRVTGSGGITKTGLADNKWHHIVYSVNGNNQSLYADGVFVNSATNILDTTGTAIRLGWYTTTGGPDAYYPGAIDDVRIYSRALSADEVKQLYNLGR